MYVYAYVCICMCLYIWMCAVCIVHVQDTYTNVYVQDTYTNVYRTHMHMHAYMHAYIHTLVGSGPLFPQSVLQCLCSCTAFRRILCPIAICVCVRESVCVCHGVCVCMCVGSATVIITANFCAQVGATGFMSARTDFQHEVTAERESLRRPQAWT